MRFEGGEDCKLTEQRHKRSKSFSHKRKEEEDKSSCSPDASQRMKLDMARFNDSTGTKKKLSPNMKVQSSLKHEIIHLEKRLQEQFAVRRTLENALGYEKSSDNGTNSISTPKPATDLIKEIAVLELEVSHLEQYLLKLYRKAFDQQVSSVSPTSKCESTKSPIGTPKGRRLDFTRTNLTPQPENSIDQSRCVSFDHRLKEPSSLETELDSAVRRCQSSLCQRSALANRISPPEESVLDFHSQPLSIKQYMQNESNMISLAEHLGAKISDHIPETPNMLSEELVKCMSSIYCKLTNPPVTNHGLSSPCSSQYSTSGSSPHDQYDIWSPGSRNNSSFDVRLDNPFNVEGLKEFSGPYSGMVEVSWINRDGKRGRDIEKLLRNFRLITNRLAEIDPRNLTHEERLAFWINVHNALVMHAFLAYGIPQNNVKRFYLLSKAAYNIGGTTLSADTIQCSILRCRTSRPGQWLRFLLPTRKLKTGDGRQKYAIEHPEPLLHFALCSGSHSDPAVRVYTPKRIQQELEISKEEYIRAGFGMRSKDQKILLPKLVDSFAKDSDLCPAGLMETIQQCLPESLKKTLKKTQMGKHRKNGIEWIPYNFSFRYLISKELVR